MKRIVLSLTKHITAVCCPVNFQSSITW